MTPADHTSEPGFGSCDPDWEISVTDVRARLADESDFVLLDCRTEAERDLARIEPSIFVPMQEVAQRLEELRAYEERPIVVHCHHGARSLKVTAFLRDTFMCPSMIEMRVHSDAIELVDRWPGYRRQRRLELHQPTEVRVHEQDGRTFGRGNLDGAIVQIVDSIDRVRPLTTRTYPHPDVHQRAAAELRAVFGLEVDRRGEDDDDDDDDDWDDDSWDDDA